MPTIVALIPARSGSKRIPNKNTRHLAGRPLLAYTIAAARESGIFSAVFVSSEDQATLAKAKRYGADPIKRPEEYAADNSPDILWIRHALQAIDLLEHQYWCRGKNRCSCTELWRDSQGPRREVDAFAILRPTSPFRSAETIRRAWERFLAYDGYDSLRAVEPARQSPYKMWIPAQDGSDAIIPLLEESEQDHLHSRPTQTLPCVLVQNASLEIVWADVLKEKGTIAGDRVLAFHTEGYEGFDLNDMTDWTLAETLVERGLATLPKVESDSE